MSGLEVDKVKLLNLQLEDGVKKKTPHIKDSHAIIECKVIDYRDFGEHRVYFGKVLYAWADERFFDETWKDNCGLILHLGKAKFLKV